MELEFLYKYEDIDVYKYEDGIKFLKNGEFDLDIYKNIRAISGVHKMDKIYYDENGLYHCFWSAKAIRLFYSKLVNKYGLIFKLKAVCDHLIKENII